LFYLSLFVCGQDNTEYCRRILVKYFGGMGCDFGDDSDNDMDTGIVKTNLYHCSICEMPSCT